MFYQFSLELVSMLARNASLPSIVQYVDQMLGNPLMITDETFSVLAYSQNRPVPDPVWKEIIQSQYSSPKLVDQTNVNEFWKRLENSSVPLFVDDEAFKGCVKRVVARIRIGSKTKGYIALLECEKKIDDEDLKALQMLAEKLGVKFNEENAISEAVGQIRDRFAKDILTGVIDSEKVIRDRAETMKLKFSKWHMVISVKAIQPQKYISQYLDDLCEILKRHAKLCIYTSDGIAAIILSVFLRNQTERNLSDRIYRVTLRRMAAFIMSADLRTESGIFCCVTGKSVRWQRHWGRSLENITFFCMTVLPRLK